MVQPMHPDDKKTKRHALANGHDRGLRNANGYADDQSQTNGDANGKGHDTIHHGKGNDNGNDAANGYVNGYAAHLEEALAGDMEPTPCLIPGIQNLGNTCFFNAILQALASLDSFHDYLEQIDDRSLQQNQQIPFTRALRDCLRDLSPVPADAPCPAVTPRRLNQELCNKLRAFRGNKQQDSQELLQFLINLVHDEQRRCMRRDGGLSDLFPSTSLFGGGGTGSISDLCFEDAMDETRWNPLTGLQVNLLQCLECGSYRPMTNRRFLDVSLSFGESTACASRAITLTDCLTQYTAAELINGVECCHCTAQKELPLKKHDYDTLKRRMALAEASTRHTSASGDASAGASVDDASVAMATIETELELHQLKEDIYQLETMLQDDADETLYQQEIASDARCRVLSDSTKRLQFSRCPDVFCFHFNRKVYHAWSGHARKVDTPVLFPMELNMSAFCRYEQPSNRSEQNKLVTTTTTTTTMKMNTKTNGHVRRLPTHRPSEPGDHALGSAHHLIYELVAVILHHGNERYGHFTAFRRVRSSRQWFFVSDDSVRAASEEEVLGSCAYMLFYERKYRTSHGRNDSSRGSSIQLSKLELNGDDNSLGFTSDEELEALHAT